MAMMTKLLFIMLGVVFGFIKLSNAQNRCQTPSGEEGFCIPIKQCPALSSLFPSRSEASDQDYLKQIRCGFSYRRPWVCCTDTPKFTAADLPSPGACGTQLSDHIVGGKHTSILDYPWMALLEYERPDSTKDFLCGGVLINKNYVLTAAHCVVGSIITRKHYSLVSVRLGEHDLTKDEDCEEDECADPVANIKIAEKIVHADYVASSPSQNDDIALIRLSEPVTFTVWIRPICLPISQKLQSKNVDETTFIVAGFGKTENASRSNVKLQVQVTGVNSQECSRVFETLDVHLTSKHLCAGGKKGEDSCNGDSGGPLMGTEISESLPYRYLGGIVSFGHTDCGKEGWPGVYTKMTEYTDWVINHMRH